MENEPRYVDREQVALAGLTEVYVPENPEYDMVLTHSLGGDSRTTWTTVGTTEKKYTYDDKGYRTGKEYVNVTEYWPARPRFNTSRKGRILVFGYSSDVSSFVGSKAPQPSFLGYARGLMEQLLKLRHKSPFRPLLFVGHSLGGYLIKECLRLCRLGDDQSSQSIPCATISIVFFCCPHVDATETTLPEAVGKFLHSDSVDNAQSLLDDFRLNLNVVQQLNTSFMSFLEERAPMLKIWTIQEASRRWDGTKTITEPPILEDALLMLKHRCERFETAYTRYVLLPKNQFHNDWSVREACWGTSDVTMHKCPQNLMPAIRNFLPFIQNRTLIHRDREVEEIIHILTRQTNTSSMNGVVGSSGSGKTHIALEVCNRILKGAASPTTASRGGKSVFWVEASSSNSIEADLKSMAHAIGLPSRRSDDSFFIFTDWLRSKYSGEWVLVFDHLIDKAVFLEPLPRKNPLPHTPTRCTLLDMIPSKANCSILFLSSDAECLKTILSALDNEIIELSPLSIDANIDLIEETDQQHRSVDGETPSPSADRKRLAELFAHNPVCLLQAARQIASGNETIDNFERQAGSSVSQDDLVKLPTRLAIQRIKATDPECMKLLASLAMLDLNTLRDVALINLLKADRDGKESSYIQMYPLVQSVVKSSSTTAEWASHIRRTVSTLCHAFMQFWHDRDGLIDFFNAAKALSAALDGVRGSSDVSAASLVKDELDSFARHFHGDWTLEKMRKEVEHVFEQVAAGDLPAMYEVLGYVNSGRGGPGSSGSLPRYWYVGKSPTAQKYLYD